MHPLLVSRRERTSTLEPGRRPLSRGPANGPKRAAGIVVTTPQNKQTNPMGSEWVIHRLEASSVAFEMANNFIANPPLYPGLKKVSEHFIWASVKKDVSEWENALC